MDYCAVVSSGGDCQQNSGSCAQVPVVIASWYPIITVTNGDIEEDGSVEFQIALEGNPIGGPGAMGACNCDAGHGTSTATHSSNFDEIYGGQGLTGFGTPTWPDDNINHNDCP
jgi:hypothetical protein